MLRRFSTKIGLSKDKAEQTNGRTNGSNNGTTNGITNGISNGNSNGMGNSTSNGASNSYDTRTNGVPNTYADGSTSSKPVIEKRPTWMSRKSTKETANHNSSRPDVEASFAQFAQLIHAARRPLPTQSGDGAYLEHAEPSGLLADIKVCYTQTASHVPLVQRG